MEKNFQNYRNEYSPNFVKVEPPTDIEIRLSPVKDSAEYHTEDLVVKVEVPTDVEIELEPTEQHAEQGLWSCDNRVDVC
ncbi:hypothetical protein EB796_008411 [Bugula neritina]|uniref:Uncharacterized protein n=1 Tax=Bugula neritina TaxID=10212 RepID=A0A7J7K6Q1_BUGNE|nr:hypothetical protein EB796_008411 [Bugula neritina]